jgi:hypothetical protein
MVAPDLKKGTITELPQHMVRVDDFPHRNVYSKRSAANGNTTLSKDDVIATLD